MELRNYLIGKSRAEFARKIGTTENYINNICQHPEQCGKNIAVRIERETQGTVTMQDLYKNLLVTVSK